VCPIASWAAVAANMQRGICLVEVCNIYIIEGIGAYSSNFSSSKSTTCQFSQYFVWRAWQCHGSHHMPRVKLNWSMEFLEASIWNVAATWQTDFNRTVHMDWTLIGRLTLILGRIFWKFPLTPGTYVPVICHVSNADWFVLCMKPTQHATCQEIYRRNNLISPCGTNCHVSTADWSVKLFMPLGVDTGQRHGRLWSDGPRGLGFQSDGPGDFW
jgi:hypothetical protein